MFKEYEVTKVNIKDVKLDGDNPNEMSEDMNKRLGQSMDEFGNTQPVIIDKETMVLADGEHRLQQYIKKGFKEIPAILISFKNDAHRRAYRQAANKIRGTHLPSLDGEEFKKIMEGGQENILYLATGMNITEVEQHLRNLSKIDEKELNENIETNQECPKCGYKWKQ